MVESLLISNLFSKNKRMRSWMKSIFRTDLKISYNPWGYFFFFLILDFFLTFFSLTLILKIWIVVGSLVLPFVFLYSAPSSPALRKKPCYLTESFPLPPAWTWILLGAAALLLRFWDVASPSRWASGDNVLMGMNALELFSHWHWKFFETFAEVPTIQARACFFLLKLSGSPFFSLYFLPALLDSLTIIVVYAASRQFFSKSFSLLMAVLWAFNYWTLYVARTPLLSASFTLWECMIFYCLGRFLNGIGRHSKTKWAGFLGLLGGVGFFTAPMWPVVTFFILMIVLIDYSRKTSKKRLPHWAFFSLLCLSLSFFLFVILREGYGGHIAAVSAWRNFSSWIQPVQVSGDYLSVLFWGITTGMCLPASGGFLNFFLDAFFFVGILELYRFRRQPLALSMVFSFSLFLLPGFLSNGVETFRILAVLPILLVLVAFGLQSLLLRLPLSKRVVFLILTLFLSAGVDGGRLFHAKIPEIKDEKQKCYEFLSQLSSEKGPGFILSELIPYENDHSLAYFTYPFNAALNPKISAENVKWMAILTEYQYAPFISSRFPFCQWMELPSGLDGIKSRHVLGILEVTPESKRIFWQWNDFYSVCFQINLQIMDLPNGAPLRGILKNLLDFYPRVPNDPFIQSCFFQKLVFNYTSEKTFHPQDTWTNWQNFSGTFQQSFGNGYQDVVLCEKYGRLLASEGKLDQARWMFLKALKQNPQNEFLKYEMNRLDHPEKTATF
jgi:hypothetical protein